MALTPASYGACGRVLSRPVPVHWAGWETTTLRLQQRGWRLAARQDPWRDSIELAMEHEAMRLYGIATGPWRGADDQRLRFEVRRCITSDLRIVELVDFRCFEPIDAREQYITEPRHIRDLKLFATVNRSEDIITDPETVNDLLERIKQMQSPEQAAIRQRQRDRERREAFQEQRVVHAQIVTLNAA